MGTVGLMVQYILNVYKYGTSPFFMENSNSLSMAMFKSYKRNDQSLKQQTLLGGIPTPLKNMSSSIGMMKLPNISGK